MNVKLKSLLLILLFLVMASCHKEKAKVIITSEVDHQEGYYQENIETVYIKGIPVERDNGYAVSGRWYFEVRDVKDTNGTNIRSVHVDDGIWGDDSYKKGDTLEISLEEYHEIFDGPPQEKNQSGANHGWVIIINNVNNNVVTSDTIYE